MSCPFGAIPPMTGHSTLVDYLAQVLNEKKTIPANFIALSFDMGTCNHKAKYQGVFP